jgi:ABC-type antimicrobial peptide transport system permease subunit
MVLSRVGLLVGAGILAGATVAVWASRFVEALLYGLRPWDPIAVATGVVALGVIGMAAGVVPAMRAARIDPARVLRE